MTSERVLRARTFLKEAIDQLTSSPHLNALAIELVMVPCLDKLPVILRIWPFVARGRRRMCVLS